MDDEATCGEEMVASTEVPEKLAQLMRHVATNMLRHAAWVGANENGQRERDALVGVAKKYQAIAVAADQAALAMKAMRNLPQVFHDPALLDPATFAAWMREKLRLQRELAALLLRHAEDSELALAAMK